ncbi:gamma carbonic anhydrase family protein [Lujinxingia litoralis]|uniref:Gamma carbonic anhydrase family protein n=1 Tax=Lujinxingia litoralis TaxID=2211119 RepID=A0A328CBH4_9DELT|nr:gamma carbonic anhydrase family protein [Lujinxingia litoralis]RAL22827.1 gamma carbonic anhydrase family protein [Lujinxingia litoralis]
MTSPRLIDFEGTFPRLEPSVFVAPGAKVIGEVSLGGDSSVWYNAVVRGDVCPITIGARTNLQDLAMVHVTGGKFATVIGDDVTVGHRAVIHGCTIGDRVLVGMGAIILDGAVIEDECIIAAGALVTPGTRVPGGSMVMGAPGKVVRPLTQAERADLLRSAAHYVQMARRHGGPTTAMGGGGVGGLP